MTGPLSGLRVLDLSRLVAGNMLGMLLADFGADVVKVEQPGRGDPLRAWRAGGLSLWWAVYGRNKRSITLNIAAAEGRELLERMLPHYDVLIESFIPGKLESWNLGPERLHDINPGLVIVRISGWGQTGPRSGDPGFGTLVEAASGLAAMSGEPDGEPLLPPFPLADMYAGLYGSNAVLMSLYQRDICGGGGQTIDVSLFESVFSVLGPLAAEHAALGRIREREGNRSRNAAPRGVYRTSDGGYLAVSASTPDTAERFLRAYGLGELLQDDRFATNEARVQHREELNALVAEAIAARTLAQNRVIIEQHQLTAVPVQTIADIVHDPHWIARGLLQQVEAPQGTVTTHAVTPRLSDTPGEVAWAGPAIGADNQSVFGELGLSDSAIADLARRGVI
jgi:crotonobetainyl-CoA:carnitine CoA-transferase CaiB-like acyl-CoA transferase